MIRDLAADELETAAHLAAAAFREDPGFSHVIPDDAVRRRRLPSLIAAILRVDAAAGGRLRGAFYDDALVGMSAVLPSGTASPRVRDWIRHARGLSWLLADPAALLRAVALGSARERQRPARHDYLRLHAVHPATQGRGIGGALALDALKQGNSVYLETFTRENAAWYEARGFEELAVISSPVRPAFWTLRGKRK